MWFCPSCNYESLFMLKVNQAYSFVVLFFILWPFNVNYAHCWSTYAELKLLSSMWFGLWWSDWHSYHIFLILYLLQCLLFLLCGCFLIGLLSLSHIPNFHSQLILLSFMLQLSVPNINNITEVVCFYLYYTIHIIALKLSLLPDYLCVLLLTSVVFILSHEIGMTYCSVCTCSCLRSALQQTWTAE